MKRVLMTALMIGTSLNTSTTFGVAKSPSEAEVTNITAYNAAQLQTNAQATKAKQLEPFLQRLAMVKAAVDCKKKEKSLSWFSRGQITCAQPAELVIELAQALQHRNVENEFRALHGYTHTEQAFIFKDAIPGYPKVFGRLPFDTQCKTLEDNIKKTLTHDDNLICLRMALDLSYKEEPTPTDSKPWWQRVTSSKPGPAGQ